MSLCNFQCRCLSCISINDDNHNVLADAVIHYESASVFTSKALKLLTDISVKIDNIMKVYPQKPSQIL